MLVSTNPQFSPRLFDYQAWKLRVHFLTLLAISVLIFLPVLVKSHWGMFSDPLQIVWKCRAFYNHSFSLSSFWQEVCFDQRPGFHILNIVLWPWCSGKPLLFYLFRLICFSGLIALTFANCFMLTGSRLSSHLAMAFFFCSGCVYENIYTLDKGELFVALSAALLTFSLLRLAYKMAIGLKLQQCPVLVFFLASANFYCIFTKQTGLLVLPFAVLIYTATFLTRFESKENIHEQNRLSVSFAFPLQLVQWNLAFAATALAAFRIFCLFEKHAPLVYFHVSKSLPFIFSHLLVYLLGMPEFLLAALLLLYSAALFLWNAKSRTQIIDTRLGSVTLAFVLTVLAGALGLSAWESTISYAWLPVLPFLVPALAIIINLQRRKAKQIVCAVYVLMLLSLLPACAKGAFEQVAMDLLFQRLSDSILSAQSNGRRQTYVLDLHHQSAYEVGEELKYLMAEKSTYSTEEDVEDVLLRRSNPIDIWNLLIGSSGDHLLDKSAYSAVVSHAADYQSKAGFDKESYCSTRTPNFFAKELKVGDLVLVPFGSIAFADVMYRGLDMFMKPLDARIQSLPQLQLKKEFEIATRIPLFASVQLGWAAYRVKAVPPYFLELADYGWMPNNISVFFSNELRGRKLLVTTGGAFVDSITATFEHGKIVLPVTCLRGQLQVTIPVQKPGKVVLSAPDDFLKRPMLLRVSDLRIE